MSSNEYYAMEQREMAGNVGALVGLILLAAAVFFIISAIFMALWNGPVMNALKKGSINKISYPTAMGLTLFCGLVFSGGVVYIR